MIKFEDFFFLGSFPLGKDELLIILEEVPFKWTYFDFKKPFKGNLIFYKSDNIELLF